MMILQYVLLRKVIRQYRRQAAHQNVSQNVDRSVNGIAFRIVIAILILYTPYIVIFAIRKFLPLDSPIKKDSAFGFALLTSYNFFYANSFVNSIIFLSINKACRRSVQSLFVKKNTSQTANQEQHPDQACWTDKKLGDHLYQGSVSVPGFVCMFEARMQYSWTKSQERFW